MSPQLATLMSASMHQTRILLPVFVDHATPHCVLRLSCWCVEQCCRAYKASIQLKQSQLILRQC